MVLKLNAKGCSPSCCGEPMKEIEAGTTDAAREKHVPAVTVDGDTVTVQVGSVAHPMMDAHYIQFIILETKTGICTDSGKQTSDPSVRQHEMNIGAGGVTPASFTMLTEVQ